MHVLLGENQDRVVFDMLYFVVKFAVVFYESLAYTIFGGASYAKHQAYIRIEELW
jgi:hypothetical protein